MAFVNALSNLAVAATGSVAVHPVSTDQPSAVEPRAPFFRWREQWCVGIKALDRDRRAIAAILNHIALHFGERQEDTDTTADASRVLGAPSALNYWLDALRARTREHFSREGALMRATHYPETAEHAGEHALMLAEYTALARNIVRRGNERLQLSELQHLKQWFIGHMLDMDKRLGHYLHENGITALPPRARDNQLAPVPAQYGGGVIP